MTMYHDDVKVPSCWRPKMIVLDKDGEKKDRQEGKIRRDGGRFAMFSN